MDDMVAVVVIGICIFLFALVLLGVGEFYGGSWSLVAQGVTKFMLLIVGFCFGMFVLFRWMRR